MKLSVILVTRPQGTITSQTASLAQESLISLQPSNPFSHSYVSTMPIVPVVMTWKGSLFNIKLDTAQPVEVFRLQVQASQPCPAPAKNHGLSGWCFEGQFMDRSCSQRRQNQCCQVRREQILFHRVCFRLSTRKHSVECLASLSPPRSQGIACLHLAAKV